MKKGISIWTMPDKTLADLFQHTRESGFDGIELAMDTQGEIALDTSESQLRRVKAMAEDQGVQLYSLATLLFWQKNYTSNDASVRADAEDITKKMLVAASALGCDTILVVPGNAGNHTTPADQRVPYDTAYERAQESLLRLTACAKAAGVSIGVENVWNGMLLSPMEFRRFLDEIGSNYIGAYFDVGNAWYDSFPQDWIRILGKRIKKVHFKDYRRGAGEHGFVDLLCGNLDFPAVMDALRQVGYDDWCTAEISPYTYYPDQVVANSSAAMDRILGRI